MSTTIVRGTRMFRQCSSAPIREVSQPDAIVNLACMELRNKTLYVLADRLASVSRGWWVKPWQARNVMAWEQTLADAMNTPELSGSARGRLGHVRAIVSEWLTDYAAYEAADYQDEKVTAKRPCR